MLLVFPVSSHTMLSIPSLQTILFSCSENAILCCKLSLYHLNNLLFSFRIQFKYSFKVASTTSRPYWVVTVWFLSYSILCFLFRCHNICNYTCLSTFSNRGRAKTKSANSPTYLKDLTQRTCSNISWINNNYVL